MSSPYFPHTGEANPSALFVAGTGSGEPQVICAFWTRVLALMVDYIVLAAILAVPGLAAFHFLATHPSLPPLIGLAVGLPYFAVLDSRIGKGQTMGKKVLGIRVVDRDGELISVSRSALRAAVLLVPFIFEGAQMRCRGELCGVWSGIQFFLAAWGFAIVYLYIFNRRTRQSLHDLVAGTFVIGATAWPLPAGVQAAASGGEGGFTRAPAVVTSKSIWQPHFAILAGLILVFCGGSYFAGKKLESSNWFSGLTPIHEALLNQPEVDNAGVMYQRNWNLGSEASNSIVITIQPGSHFGDDETEAAKMAGIALEASPEASSAQYLTIVIKHNVNFGLAHYDYTRTYTHTPEEWREHLPKSKADSQST